MSSVYNLRRLHKAYILVSIRQFRTPTLLHMCKHKHRQPETQQRAPHAAAWRGCKSFEGVTGGKVLQTKVNIGCIWLLASTTSHTVTGESGTFTPTTIQQHPLILIIIVRQCCSGSNMYAHAQNTAGPGVNSLRKQAQNPGLQVHPLENSSGQWQLFAATTQHVQQWKTLCTVWHRYDAA